MKPGAGGRGSGAGVAVLAFLLASCARVQPLPVLGSVPGFQLTTQSGGAFDSQSLAGHVWVADFIYTTCTGPCPMMSWQMRRVQTATQALPDVRLVSFTVDPAHDTPPVLAAYSRNFKADPQRWLFLTGDPARLNDLGLHSFRLNSVDGSLVHSTRFVLVDRRERIRGYYSTDEDGFMKNLLRDIRRLERESS
ncbi:MAG: SCO family protein [Acidobacteriia bacterium]|nr:SCO family protein [Terriglobia bacterium]